ncbi:MAG: hypothetical protein RLP44_23470 [Aggregatilineales bacterium]
MTIRHLTSLYNSSLLVGIVGDFRTNEVVFWNIDDNLTELYRLDTSRVDDLSFSEDSRLMAISRNGYIELWGVTE